MILTADLDGERADQALARLVGGLTRSAAQRLLEEGKVTSGGRILKKNERLQAGQTLEVTIPEPEPLSLEPEDIPLDIVYEDGDLLVINKPKGLVVHPAAGHWSGTLVNALLYHCRDSLSGINGTLRPGIVHRIDKDTSGLLIVAKNDFAHQALAAQLQDHSLSRTYVCLVVGGVKADSGTIDAPIGRHPTDRKKMAVVSGGKRAVTHFQVLERFSGATPFWSAAWRPAAPTRSASTWPIATTPSWATWSMAGANRSWDRTANASTPALSPSAIPAPARS